MNTTEQKREVMLLPNKNSVTNDNRVTIPKGLPFALGTTHKIIFHNARQQLEVRDSIEN